MKKEALCGKLFEEEGASVESICPKDNSETYVQYLYTVTHYNNPREGEGSTLDNPKNKPITIKNL